MVQVAVENRRASVPSSCSPACGTERRRYLVTLLGLVLIIVLAWSVYPTVKMLQDRKPDNTIVKTKGNARHVVPRRETIHERDVLWAEPDGEVRGLLFVAHGCSHSNTDWFVGCEGCLGLPEELAIVDIGLDLGLLVVAISSTNRISKCWHTELDIEPVAKVLATLSSRYRLESKPIIAFGASSGGDFVSNIATLFQAAYGVSITAFVSQIAAASDDEKAKCRVYITMDGDERTKENAKYLVNDGLAKGFETRHLQLPPLPITDEFFTRIPGFGLTVSARLAQSLREAGFLDENNFQRKDPRQSKWRDVLSAELSRHEWIQDTLKADESPISEVMNVAYGRHEMTRDGVREALQFCLGHR